MIAETNAYNWYELTQPICSAARMDLLTFIVELIKAIAWPVAAIVIALLFRDQIIALLKRLKKGKIGPAEFEFEEDVRALREEVMAGGSAPHFLLRERSARRAASDPRSAILNAWLDVVNEATIVAMKKGLISDAESQNPGSVVRAILRADILSRRYALLLNELRHLRNQAAHEWDFNPAVDAILSYVELANDLIGALKKLEI